MEIYRKKSKAGKINILISETKPTQFQLYLDKIFDPETQEGIPELIKTILEGKLILPSPRKDPKELMNRRKNKCFSDLARLMTLGKNKSIYAIAGTHRIAAILIANWLYKTKDYLDAKEYDLASIKNLAEFNNWRSNEFVLQKIKGSNIGQSYKGFEINKYQKGFDSQFTAKYGGKRIFVKKCIYSWEELILKNANTMTTRLKYMLSKNLIEKQKDISIAKDIISFLK